PEGPPPACVGGYCDDGDPCTVDRCQLPHGCTHERQPTCPSAGCLLNYQCADAKECNGAEECAACVGCFLHDWACCSESAMCVAGVRPRDGSLCAGGTG